jgi:hypothetical protein
MRLRSLSCLLFLVATGALRALPVEPSPETDFQVATLEQGLVQDLLPPLRDPAFQARVAQALTEGRGRVPLLPLAEAWSRDHPTGPPFPEWVRARDRDLRRHLGIEEASPQVLELRLVGPVGNGQMDWGHSVVLVRPASGTRPGPLGAFRLDGQPCRLDPASPPEGLVLILEADAREVVRAGLQVVNEGLESAGVGGPSVPQGEVSCLRLASIQLSGRRAAWWEDELEIYALASGIDPGQDRPRLRLVRLPYLQERGTVYRPGQVVLFWPDYRYRAANLQIWEHDGGVNYKDLLAALLKGVARILTMAGFPEFSFIPQVAEAVVDAMPATWWQDKDTLLDTFYTLEEGHSYVDHLGAARKVRATLLPWRLKPR